MEDFFTSKWAKLPKHLLTLTYLQTRETSEILSWYAINQFGKADKITHPKMLVLSSGSTQLARKSTSNVQRSKHISTVASQRNASRGEEVQKRNSATVSAIMSGKFQMESNSKCFRGYVCPRIIFTAWFCMILTVSGSNLKLLSEWLPRD